MNQYKIIDRLASGSFGVVFKAVRLTDNRIFVLKRIPLAELDDASKQTAIHEVELMQQLHHPHIVSHRDAFLFNHDDLCIVMDYYGGGDLSQVICSAAEALSNAESQVAHHVGAVHNAPKRRGHPPHGSDGMRAVASPVASAYLPESRVMLWFVEMGLALHYLHSHRIVHRDLKTQNVFLNTANGEVAVGDFGVARIAETIAQAHAASPSSTGTPLYMAPEVLQGGHATFKSDVWSLGCILYELLALVHPFASSDFSGLVIRIAKAEFLKLPKHYTKPLHKLVERMLDKDPKKRPLIDEILTAPYVKSYLRTYLSIRVPLETHDSQGEQMLLQQLSALGIDTSVETECTEDVLTQSALLPSHTPTRIPPQRGDLDSVSSAASLPLEELNSPSMKYETMYVSHVAEAFSPDIAVPGKRRPNHVRSESNPSLGFAVGGATGGAGDAVPQLQQPPPPLHRRSTSLGAVPSSRRTTSSMLPTTSNVDDMRGKTIGEIEEEVRRFRHLVQEELASRTSVAHPGHVEDVMALPDDVKRAGRVRRAEGSPHLTTSLRSGGGPWSSESVGLAPLAQPSPAMYANGLEDQNPPASRRSVQQQQPESQFYRGLAERVAPPPQGRLNELSKMQRRRQLHMQCVDVLGEKTFHEIYTYYNNVPPTARDVDVVRRYAPERAMWPVLPTVEAILQLDREMMHVSKGAS